MDTTSWGEFFSDHSYQSSILVTLTLLFACVVFWYGTSWAVIQPRLSVVQRFRLWGEARQMRKERDDEVKAMFSEDIREAIERRFCSGDFQRHEADELLRRLARLAIPDLLPAIDPDYLKKKIRDRRKRFAKVTPKLPDAVEGGRRKKILI